MMNKSKIDWCDFSWNPVTGCWYGCPYCYAKNQARRFSGDVRVNKSDPQIKAEKGPVSTVYTLAEPFKSPRGQTVPFPVGFEPTLHEYRLGDPARKKKPATIFVCSMADLFGPWIPDKWIERVFEACKDAPWHHYLFLTKNPDRYNELEQAGLLPHDENFWYGASVTTAWEADYRLSNIPATVHRFASVEPIHEGIDLDLCRTAGPGQPPLVDWLIVGAETGHRAGKVAPERDWLMSLAGWAHINGVPFLFKDSEEIRAVWKKELPQEFPASLEPMQPDAVPHCKGCDKCSSQAQGERGNAYYCADGWTAAGYDDRGDRHILGRYTRTSPPWCPKRDKA